MHTHSLCARRPRTGAPASPRSSPWAPSVRAAMPACCPTWGPWWVCCCPSSRTPGLWSASSPAGRCRAIPSGCWQVSLLAPACRSFSACTARGRRGGHGSRGWCTSGGQRAVRGLWGRGRLFQGWTHPDSFYRTCPHSQVPRRQRLRPSRGQQQPPLRTASPWALWWRACCAVWPTATALCRQAAPPPLASMLATVMTSGLLLWWAAHAHTQAQSLE